MNNRADDLLLENIWFGVIFLLKPQLEMHHICVTFKNEAVRFLDSTSVMSRVRCSP
jgi:hypothetical protein